MIVDENLTHEQKKYKHVGGWLAVLVVFLFLAPLLVLSQYSNANEIYMSFFIYFGLAIYGVVVGISLLRLKPYAVRKTKEFLLINLGTAIIITIFFFSKEILSQVFLRSIVSFTVWYSYLSFASRVKNTYNLKSREGNPNWKLVMLTLVGIAILIFLLSLL